MVRIGEYICDILFIMPQTVVNNWFTLLHTTPVKRFGYCKTVYRKCFEQTSIYFWHSDLYCLKKLCNGNFIAFEEMSKTLLDLEANALPYNQMPGTALIIKKGKTLFL